MMAFLIPPVCGDDVDLAALRRRLAHCVTLDLVDLPDAGAPGAVIANMEATAGFVTAEIQRRRPTGDIALVGFSFGASTALAVANQLEAAGRTISLLAILDGPFATTELQGWFDLFRRAMSLKGSARTIVELAATSDVTRQISWTALSPQHIGQKQSDPIRRAMLAHLRGKALKSWTPRACLANGVLVRTRTFGEENRRRWDTLCPNLTKVEVPGDHDHLLRDTSLAAVVAALADLFGAASVRRLGLTCGRVAASA